MQYVIEDQSLPLGHQNGLSLDVNTRSISGSTLLHFASLNGSLVNSQYLLDNRANPNVRNNFGETPLHWATRGGHLHVVSLLATAGTDVHEEDNDGNTAVHWAAEYDYPHIISFLAEKGADLSASNLDDETPLDLALDNECHAAKTAIKLLTNPPDLSKRAHSYPRYFSHRIRSL